MNKLIIFIVLALQGALSAGGHTAWSACDDSNFLQSFIQHYEFNPEGRYTHEYHPFLLQKTAQSFDDLEARLTQENFDLDGRIIIMGYEENAAPQYYTNFKCARINDEATRKNRTGWSLKLHNRFGFMTGFLFKDVSEITNAYFAQKPYAYKHIDVQSVPIFDDRALIFQEHAFGDALDLMQHMRKRMIKKLVASDDKGVLTELEHFWRTLYHGGFKVGNKQLAGTQDVFFSIEYVKHLVRSLLSLINFFTGPDITYPIEITAKQSKQTTLHAQHFVKEMVHHLRPIQNQKTVYVFCSFVDGVGKSTMLGNIKNWMQCGEAVEKFGHVDNSSSQLCDLFSFKDDVFIADLPAQISHFTYKPDGHVFVDIRTHDDEALIQELEAFVVNNKQVIIAQGKKIFSDVKTVISTQGYSAPALNDSTNPLYAFAKNIFLLKKDTTNDWIPFSYNGNYYLFKDGRPLEIRFLTSLSMVKSEGLKNIESDQMIFTDGIRLPLPYNVFLDDLVNQFKAQGIKHVVFVDFISMYPRSSRENVRINYLLQQMALLDLPFQINNSLYKDFVSGGELLYALMHDKTLRPINDAFNLEAIVRLALFKLLIERSEGDLTGVDMHTLTHRLQKECAQLSALCKKTVASYIHDKIVLETRKLEKTYGLSKSFVNIQQFSFSKICAYCSLLQEIFTQKIEHDVINESWNMSGNIHLPMPLHTEGERLHAEFNLDHGMRAIAHFVFHSDCKNELLLASVLRSLRSSWYASLFNILSTVHTHDERVVIEQEMFPFIPLLVLRGSDDLMFIMQRKCEPWEGDLPKNIRSNFYPFQLLSVKPSCYTPVGEKAYRVDWECKSANSGMLGFDCYLDKEDDKKQMYNMTSISYLVQQYQSENGASAVMPTSELWQKLIDDYYWIQESKSLQNSATRNPMYTGMVNALMPTNKKSPYASMLWRSRKAFFADNEYKKRVRMVVRLLATLEMILKDPDADIVVRDGNREDFKAAIKLFEHVVLPKYAKILFKSDLFDDYDAVEPYPSWEYWERIGT
jgi:hypothetical protein